MSCSLKSPIQKPKYIACRAANGHTTSYQFQDFILLLSNTPLEQLVVYFT